MHNIVSTALHTSIFKPDRSNFRPSGASRNDSTLQGAFSKQRTYLQPSAYTNMVSLAKKLLFL